MLKGNAIVGQSGGPTPVINASLAGVISQARKFKGIEKLLGMRWGIEGFLQENLIDLAKEKPSAVEGLKRTPSSALGSCRQKLKEENLPPIRALLEKYNIRYFFLIGGNDTMDTIQKVETYCRKTGYELIGVGIPKTVDNDLFGTDHTPGYPSAGRYVALSVLQGGLLARDMQKVDQFTIYQAVGRDSGWLAAASVLAKRAEADAPHLILVPEAPFEQDRFLAAFEAAYRRYGWVSIAMGEGVTKADGSPLSASETRDKFGNVEFGAMGGTSVAMQLHRLISAHFKGMRGEFDVVESLQMCGADRVAALDVKEAFGCGVEAVRLASKQVSGQMVTIVRKSDHPYRSAFGTAALSDVAVKAKPMPAEFVDKKNLSVTEVFVDYVRPLVGALPEYVALKGVAYKE